MKMINDDDDNKSVPRLLYISTFLFTAGIKGSEINK